MIQTMAEKLWITQNYKNVDECSLNFLPYLTSSFSEAPDSLLFIDLNTF